MSQVSENLRFLLWFKRVPWSEWAPVLGHWAECEFGRAEELLEGSEPAQHELEHIVRAVDYSEEALVRTSLLAAHGIDVLQENIRFLTEHLGYGRKKDLAAAINIYPTTITKWRSGESHPQGSNLEALCRYFGLPASINIEVEPIFLVVETREQREQRVWVRARMEKLSPETWRLAYPFLKSFLAEFLP
jgi:transcriptional regulator with XRE-family HTH domain